MRFKSPHAASYNMADFNVVDTAVLPVAVYSEFGRKTITAGMGVSIGFGDLAGQHNAVGRLYLDMKSAADAAVNGDVRADVHDSMDRPVLCLFQGSTEQLRTSATLRTEKRPFPEIRHIVKEDSAIVLKFKPDAAIAIGVDHTVLHMDVTEWTAEA